MPTATNIWVSLVLPGVPDVEQAEATHADDFTIRPSINLQISAGKTHFCKFPLGICPLNATTHADRNGAENIYLLREEPMPTAISEKSSVTVPFESDAFAFGLNEQPLENLGRQFATSSLDNQSKRVR